MLSCASTSFHLMSPSRAVTPGSSSDVQEGSADSDIIITTALIPGKPVSTS